MGITIDVHFKYTEKEYASAVKWYYMKSSSIIIDFIIAVTIIATGSFLLLYNHNSIINMFMVALGILFLSILIYAIYINPIRIFRSEPKFRDEYFLSFADESISFKTENINSN